MNKKNSIEEIFVEAFKNLEKNNLDAAEKLFDEVLKMDQNHFKANFFLASMLLQKRQFEKAKELFLKAISINPNYSEPYNNLGIAMKELGQKSESITYFQKAIQIEPNHKMAHNNLGIALKELGKYQEAINSYEKAIEVDPNNTNAFNNLGIIFTEFGDIKKSTSYFKKAIEIQTNNKLAHANLLFNLCWLNSSKEYLDLSKKYYNLIPDYSERYSFHTSREKFLKVGFVSGDFKNHPVAYFLIDTLKNLKEKNLKLFAYSNDLLEDDYTKLFKENFHSWKQISDKNDQDVINLIRKDNIDILFDLSGHSKGGRLTIFKNRCAPIQASWSGWLASTGVKEIDYIIGDPYVTPLSDQSKFVEKIYQLKNIWQSLSTSNLDPKIFTTENNTDDLITFGSFNNTIKLNETVIKTWAKIFNEIPKSKLFLKYSSFDVPEIKKKFFQKIISFGVDENQIIIEGRSSRKDYLKCYNRIDIALDSFPVTGGTTSFEASYMGVPTLTKVSENNAWFKSGVSINKNLNMDDWIAKTEEEYISKAIKFSENKKKLINLKKELRNLAFKSPLFDSVSFANNFYEMLLDISKKK